MPTNKKISWILSAIAAIVIGIILLVMGKKVVDGLKNAPDASATSISSYKEGMYIKGTTDYVWDYYCNETEEKDGKSTEKYRWYLVYVELPADAENGRRDCYLGVKVPVSDAQKYEKLKDDTLQYELTFQGELKKCTGDILKYKEQFMKEADKASMEQEGIKFSDYINCPDYYVELKTTKYGNTLFWFGIGIIGVGIILFIAFYFNNRAEKNPTEYINPYAAARAMQNPQGGYGYGTAGTQPSTPGGMTDAYGNPISNAVDNNQLGNSNVGVSTGFYRQDDQDELSKMLAEEDQKVANYNFKTGLSGSDRVEEDK